jgi:phosphatidylserine decarboxylase
LSLRNIRSVFQNERVTTVIDQGRFQIGVVQIASRMVRRIVSYHREGDRVQKGQRIGMIKFGSQVDVVIPKLKDLEIRVQKGETVKAGKTILAMYS